MVLLGEYRNQNSRRNYPFTDNAILTDTDGIELPLDFIIDAFMYPIDLENSLYLSKIDFEEKKIYFADTITDTIHGCAEFTLDDSEAYVYDIDYTRQIGTLVFGAGLTSIFGGRNLRTFLPLATSFCPTAFIALNQEGVRGIAIGNSLITGAITVEGEDGINITSYIGTTGKNILKIDVVGVLRPTDEDCGDACPLIKTIYAYRMPNSLFMVAKPNAYSISLSGYYFTLSDVCAKQRANKLPDDDGNLPLKPKTGDDPCEEPPDPPVPPIPGPEFEVCIDVTAGNGNCFINAPSTVDSINVCGIDEISHAGTEENQHLSFPAPLKSGQEAMADVDDFVNPPSFTDGIKIGFKGLAQYNRKTK